MSKLTDHDVIYETTDDGSPLYQHGAISDPSSGEHGVDTGGGVDTNSSPEGKPKENTNPGHPGLFPGPGKRNTHTGRSDVANLPAGDIKRSKKSVTSKLAGALRGAKNAVKRVMTPPDHQGKRSGQGDWLPSEGLAVACPKFDTGRGQQQNTTKKEPRGGKKHVKRVEKFAQEVPKLEPPRMLGVLKAILEATQSDAVIQLTGGQGGLGRGGLGIVVEHIPKDVLKMIVKGKFSADTAIKEEQSQLLAKTTVSVLCVGEGMIYYHKTTKRNVQTRKYTPCAVGHCYKVAERSEATEFCASHDLDGNSKSLFSDEQRSGDRKTYRLVNMARDIMRLPPSARIHCLKEVHALFPESVIYTARQSADQPTILLEKISDNDLPQLERVFAEIASVANWEGICELLGLRFDSHFPLLSSKDKETAKRMDVRLPSLGLGIQLSIRGTSTCVVMRRLCQEDDCLTFEDQNGNGYCVKHARARGGYEPKPRKAVDAKARGGYEPKPQKAVDATKPPKEKVDEFEGVECSCELRFSQIEDKDTRDLAMLVSSEEVAFRELGDDFAKLIDMIQNDDKRNKARKAIKDKGASGESISETLATKLKGSVKAHKLISTNRHDNLYGYLHTICVETEYSKYISYVSAERVLNACEFGASDDVKSNLGGGAIYIPDVDAFVRNVLACTWGHTDFAGFQRLLTTKGDRGFYLVRPPIGGVFLIHSKLGEDADSILEMKKSASLGMSKYELMKCCPREKITTLQELTIENGWTDQQVDRKAREYGNKGTAKGATKGEEKEATSERRIPRKAAKKELEAEKATSQAALQRRIEELEAEKAASQAALQRRFEELEAEKASQAALQRRIEELEAEKAASQKSLRDRIGELAEERDSFQYKAERLERSNRKLASEQVARHGGGEYGDDRGRYGRDDRGGGYRDDRRGGGYGGGYREDQGGYGRDDRRGGYGGNDRGRYDDRRRW